MDGIDDDACYGDGRGEEDERLEEEAEDILHVRGDVYHVDRPVDADDEAPQDRHIVERFCRDMGEAFGVGLSVLRTQFTLQLSVDDDTEDDAAYEDEYGQRPGFYGNSRKIFFHCYVNLLVEWCIIYMISIQKMMSDFKMSSR